MRVTTESGTVYEFTKAGDKFRRLRKKNDIDDEAPERAELRRDGQWLGLFAPVEVTVGQPMSLAVEPLAEEASITMRFSTVVIGVEE